MGQASGRIMVRYGLQRAMRRNGAWDRSHNCNNPAFPRGMSPECPGWAGKDMRGMARMRGSRTAIRARKLERDPTSRDPASPARDIALPPTSKGWARVGRVR